MPTTAPTPTVVPKVTPPPAAVPTVTPPPAATAATAGGLDSGPRAADTPVDPGLASKGKGLFNQKTCITCHKMDARLVGPALGPVPRQRSAAWILAMIERPAEMTRTDPIAKQLLQEYRVQMVLPKPVSADEARALLEYMKSAAK
jgi:mono/diheme cytochrome c family protein